MNQLTVSPARLRHLPRLARLSWGTHSRSSSLVLWHRRWSPLWGAGGAVLSGHGGGRTLILEEQGRLVGVAQAKARREPDQWDLVYLALEGMDSATLELRRYSWAARRLRRLLSEVCHAAAEQGVIRVFARLPEGSEHLELFREQGFAPLVTEYRYLLPHRPAAPPAEVPGLRPQRSADAFAVWQLYQRSTPKVVQMAEGLRSTTWSLPAPSLRRRLTRRCQVGRYVVEQGGQVVGWLQVVAEQRGPHQVRLMVGPAHGELAEPLLRLALSSLDAHPEPAVQCEVRGYQTAVMAALEQLGFHRVDSQVLLVNQLAVKVPARGTMPVLEKVQL